METSDVIERKPAVERNAVTPKAVIIPAVMFLLGWIIASKLAAGRNAADSVVATVNGTTISKDAFLHRLQVAAGNATLKGMVGEELQLQFAKQFGVLPSDEDVDAKYNEVAKDPKFADSLSTSHQTPDDIRRSIRVKLIAQTALIKGVTATEEEAQAFYQKNIDKRNPQARYYQPETAQVQVIITTREADTDSAIHDLAAGLPFEQAAKKYSIDASKANGGVTVVQRGRVDPSKYPGLEQHVFQLNNGQQIEKIRIGSQWWTIRCLRRVPETTIPYARVKDECLIGARLVKGIPINGAKTQAASSDFLKSATVTPVWPEYQNVQLKQQQQ